MIGKVFGRYSVIEKDTSQEGVRRNKWVCRCLCGTVKSVRKESLVSGKTVSCGCYCIDRVKEANTTHGNYKGSYKKPLGWAWNGMMGRCYDEKYHSFHRYGGRGITVCDRWKVYENFEADVGKRPSPSHTLDRIDVNGNYEPSNCRWATKKEQANNTVNVLFIEYGGTVLPLSIWADKLGMNRGTLYSRLYKYKWDVKTAFEKDVK